MTKKLSELNIVLIEIISIGTDGLQNIANEYEKITGNIISLTTIAKYRNAYDEEIVDRLGKFLETVAPIKETAEAILRVKSGEEAWYDNHIYVAYVADVIKPEGRYGRRIGNDVILFNKHF